MDPLLAWPPGIADVSAVTIRAARRRSARLPATVLSRGAGARRERRGQLGPRREDPLERGFGREPVYIREGGSIPIVNTFTQELGADALLLGWGQSDDNTHSPNEKFSLDDFHRGIRASAALWQELANLPHARK